MNGNNRVSIGSVQGQFIRKSAVYLAVSTAGGCNDNEHVAISEINVYIDPTSENGHASGTRKYGVCFQNINNSVVIPQQDYRTNLLSCNNTS